MSTAQSLIGNRYRLERSLGEGGMGQVFLAADTLFQHKLVALKLLKERMAENESIRRRFDQEIRVCAALANVNIVQVTDCGVTEEGYPYYVMEYLDGRSLSSILAEEGRLSPERAVNIAIQICNGLAAAHEGFEYQGKKVTIVHRDLKPENIFIVDSGMGELVKILDFGIAKICSEIQSTIIPQTQQGMFLGTAHYSSPEQIRVEPVGPTSDIYSLGVMLYEMLTGTDPFGLVAEGNTKMQAWLKAHLNRPPIPLRQQPDCEHISPALEAVVMRCLEKSPDRRFPSAVALAAALQTAIQDNVAPVTVPLPPTATIPWGWLIACLSVILVAITVVVWLLATPTKKDECTFESDPNCYCEKQQTQANPDPRCSAI
ncbi:MAG: serine/threonine-protein kinase [Pseudanabaenaceae cyanobacterium SKYGB_i_bin29]|nr:serine/threonine protein kinase [Pseudanabaenaceae cyanobacterium SKYG29]MDW8421420.1 serine/threonine-protein kinase [Pseudanabaenaceae cyanobacterium SKYGB_i_bin29]